MAAQGPKSKKASAASSTFRLLEGHTLFLDRCLGRKTVRQALEAAGAIVAIHEDHFPQDCEDQQWIVEVGKRRWIILTKDRHIRDNQLEVVSLLRSNTATFILTSAELTGQAMGAAFVAALPEMDIFLQKFALPFVATVTAAGKVQMLHTQAMLIKKIQ
jgi:hypothetical protein